MGTMHQFFCKLIDRPWQVPLAGYNKLPQTGRGQDQVTIILFIYFGTDPKFGLDEAISTSNFVQRLMYHLTD